MSAKVSDQVASGETITMTKHSSTGQKLHRRYSALSVVLASLGVAASAAAQAPTAAAPAAPPPPPAVAPPPAAPAAPASATPAPAVAPTAATPAPAPVPPAAGTTAPAPEASPPTSAAASAADTSAADTSAADTTASASITTDTAATEASGDTSADEDEGTEFASAEAGDSLVLGLSPGAPQITSLPGGVTPAFGQQSTSSQDWRFDFHGLVLLPLRIGIGERENALVGQKTTTLHGPPLVPGNFESFEHTGVLPDPWVQLNFSYGNKDVTATVIVAARTVNSGDSYFNPPDHAGINDAFLTYRYPISKTAALSLNMGAYSHNYGNMGEYDLGKYGTPLIARIGGSGFTGRGDFDLGSLVLLTEVGFFGQLNKAPVGIEPAGWNGFADPNVGSSFAFHGHAVGYFNRSIALGAHAVHAFVQDDRATPLPQNTDGSIDVFGLDLRFTLQQYGHLYLGYAHTSADQARAVSGIVRVLNAPGGPGLIKEYFGPDSNNGSGTLDTVGAQYDLSLGHYLRLRERTVGPGPDLVISPFAVMTMVGSEDTTVDDENRLVYDDITKFKYGAEITYSWLSWLSGSFRYDRVLPDMDDTDETFAVLSPRLIFSSDWGSQDQVVLQYSRWLNGSRSAVYDGYPAVKDLSIQPDEQSIMLSASMWW